MMQLRPKGSEDPRFYSPNRDLAYIGPGLLRRALQVLDPAYPGPVPVWLERLLAEASDEQMTAAVQAVQRFVLLAANPQVANAQEAAQNCGLHAVDGAAQTLLLARLGYVVLGGIFAAMRDACSNLATNASLQELEAEASRVARALEAAR